MDPLLKVIQHLGYTLESFETRFKQYEERIEELLKIVAEHEHRKPDAGDS